MSKLSCSFTLGKASKPGGANVEHNNREFLADNIDANRIFDNVTYVRQDVRAAYDELFSESLAEYNAKQTRADRKIDDYFEHIYNGSREESFYELIVQFGDMKTAPVGSENGELSKIMLDEYIKSFKERNPNMKIFNAVAHFDEASPHLHINIIPFYTEGRKNGLSKGVSMKAALSEQGFSNSNKKQNSLVAWEDSEMKAMENILNQHNLERDVKGATHKHQSVPEYKESQDWRKLPKRKKKNLTTLECYENDLRKTREENSLLKVENEKLLTEKNSQWRSFFFSDSDKQIFVQSKLDELKIPYRESEQGFESPSCYVEKIRSIEKQYKSTPTSHRDVLRNQLDKILMCVENYDDVFGELESCGYEIKHSKYTAVKPKDGSAFIRLKSLGELYNEQALRNRIDNRHVYENSIDNEINSIEDKRSLECRYHFTVKQYVITFKAGKLPAKKVRPKEPFTFVNDAELDRLAALNRKINQGVTISSLRNDMGRLEKSVANLESRLTSFQKDLKLFSDLQKSSFLIFEKNERNPAARKFLADNGITAENYQSLSTDVAEIKRDISEYEQSLKTERNALNETVYTLTSFERIMSMTYIQNLADMEKNYQQLAVIGNGVKPANASTAVANRIDSIAEKVAEVVEARQAYTPPKR